MKRGRSGISARGMRLRQKQFPTLLILTNPPLSSRAPWDTESKYQMCPKKWPTLASNDQWLQGNLCWNSKLFRAPRFGLGAEQDFRFDRWSLGSIIYEVSTDFNFIRRRGLPDHILVPETWCNEILKRGGSGCVRSINSWA